MKKIGIITFNSALKTDKTKDSKLVKEIKLNVELKGKVWTNKTIERLAKEVEKVKQIPKTSQPATGDIIKVYQAALKEFEQIIVLTPDMALSGTHQNAKLAQKMLEENSEKIHIVHTNSFAISEVYFCEEALLMIEQEKSMEEIVQHLNNLTSKITTYIIPGNFEYLKMSGRVNVAQLLVGKLMMLKLLIKHVHPEAKVYKKERGFKRILKDIAEEIDNESITKIYCGHLNPDIKELQMLKQILGTKVEVIEAPYPSIIMAAHFGPKTLGFMTIKK
ncbi:MAG: DegV family protein [Mycoplasmatales bacterium]